MISVVQLARHPSPGLVGASEPTRSTFSDDRIEFVLENVLRDSIISDLLTSKLSCTDVFERHQSQISKLPKPRVENHAASHVLTRLKLLLTSYTPMGIPTILL